MDYAFGEQAYETIDELLKPFKDTLLNVESVSIMGKREFLWKRRYYDSECPYQ
jgi:hypothetical protein